MSNPTFIYNGHTYLLTDSSLTWQQAQAQAVSLGGNLVTINDAAEQAWLTTTFTDGGWIGYTDQVTEGVFQWISGETSTYTNWASGEPNNYNDEDYALMYSSGLWNDNNASYMLAGIIEINNTANNPPTLTAFSAPVSVGNEDNEITVSFTDLQVNGNEADVDGTVNAFVIKAVSSGSLKIGLSPSTATSWNALSNNTIDATHQAYWTPASNANGALDAFTVVAKDNSGLESAIPIPAIIRVNAVSDVTVTAGITPMEGGTMGTFVISLDSPAPVGGLTINYALAGTATLATDYTVTSGNHITNVTGNNFIIAAGETSATLTINALNDAIFDPNETIILNLTTGTGYQLTANTTAILTIIDTAQNHAPILIAPAAINYTDTTFVDTFTTVTDVLIASDSDSNTPLTYSIVGGTDNGNTIDMSNAYGLLSVTKATGVYQFIPYSSAIEALNSKASDTFTVTVSDGQLTDSKTLTINIVQSGITESNDNDTLTGTASNDVFNGLAGNDTISGLTGNDIINGGIGADCMMGGKGNDTYNVDNINDKVIELKDEGADTVYSSIDYTLSDNVEKLYINLERSSSAVLTGTGNALDNYLKADGRMDISAHATLYGLAGDDILDSNIRSTSTLLGGEGNDLYYVYNAGDEVKESINQGIDTVSSSITAYTLTANVENLILRNGAFGDVGISGTGNELDNYLTGGNANNILNGLAGDDTLVGGEGADTLIGGLGKDTYNLTEITAATDTVSIAQGDSLAISYIYDVVTGFQLGTNTLNTTGADKLDLASTNIASNVVSFNGSNVGNIKSHFISDGIITFDDTNHYANPLTITEIDLANVFNYLQANIRGHDTVAFISEGNTFVFQDGGATDTLVELVGVTASSVSISGLAMGSVWIA